MFRPGADEFVVVLPNAVSAEAAATAERIRASIERADLGRSLGVPVTTSMGVACSENEARCGQLLNAADEAAFAAKFSGKNRVMSWPLDASVAAADFQLDVASGYSRFGQFRLNDTGHALRRGCRSGCPDGIRRVVRL